MLSAFKKALSGGASTVAAMMLLDTPRRPTGKAALRAWRRNLRQPKPRRQRLGMEEARTYLGDKALHPARSSSVRKLQRAFRIAGQSFKPEVA